MAATRHECREGVFGHRHLHRLLGAKGPVPQAGPIALYGPRPFWFTSALVRAEGYSWFLHKHGEESARKFRFFLDSLEGLEIFDADADLHKETCRILDRLRGTRLTYVDASSLALMEHHKIKMVWATDYQLGLTGAEVLPQA